MYVIFTHVEDWRCDQLRCVNRDVKQLPIESPVVRKSYFQTQLVSGPSKCFTKEAYKLLDSDCDMTLIHYLGDEKMTEQSPRGNSKEDTQRNFSRTCPSVLRAVKEQCETTSLMKVYRNEITKVPPHSHLSVKQPRDIKQVENFRSGILARQRLSHDGILNLHDLAIDMPHFSTPFTPIQTSFVFVDKRISLMKWTGFSF